MARRPGPESETPAAGARGDEAELWEAHSHFLLVAEAWKITAVQARSGSHINRATSRWRQQVGMRPVVDGDGQGRRCSNSAAHSLVISLSRQSEHGLISFSCTARASLLAGILMMAPSADSDEAAVLHSRKQHFFFVMSHLKNSLSDIGSGRVFPRSFCLCGSSVRCSRPTETFSLSFNLLILLRLFACPRRCPLLSTSAHKKANSI